MMMKIEGGPDARKRRLERMAAQGDKQAENQLLIERARTGEINLEMVKFAASLGHEGARQALADAAPKAVDTDVGLQNVPKLVQLLKQFLLKIYYEFPKEKDRFVRGVVRQLAEYSLQGWKRDDKLDHCFKTTDMFNPDKDNEFPKDVHKALGELAAEIEDKVRSQGLSYHYTEEDNAVQAMILFMKFKLDELLVRERQKKGIKTNARELIKADFVRAMQSDEGAMLNGICMNAAQTKEAGGAEDVRDIIVEQAVRTALKL